MSKAQKGNKENKNRKRTRGSLRPMCLPTGRRKTRASRPSAPSLKRGRRAEVDPIAVGQPLSLGAAAPETARLNEAFHSTRASRPSPRSRSSAKRSSEPAALSLRPATTKGRTR